MGFRYPPSVVRAVKNLQENKMTDAAKKELMPDLKPKDGFQYVEINFPDKGITLSGAMDNDSIDRIIDLTIKAEVDTGYTRAEPPCDDAKRVNDEWDYLLGEISANGLVLHDGTLDTIAAYIRRPAPIGVEVLEALAIIKEQAACNPFGQSMRFEVLKQVERIDAIIAKLRGV
jgi:hypothetical protein